MEKEKSLNKNMIMGTILTLSNFIFPLITYSYVARIISPSGIGKVAFVNSVLSYFIYIASLGIPSYGLRECAKLRNDKEKLSKTFQELLIINLVSTMFAYILLFIVIISLNKLYNYKILFLIMSSQIFLNSIGVEWLYQALEEYSYITIRSVFFKVIGVLLTFILIKSPDDILLYGFLTIFAASANYICNFINIHKYITFKKFKNYNLKKHFKPIFSLLTASIIISIYANFDIVMLGFISSEYEVGLYNAALKIKSILLSLSTAITAVMIPRISYYIQNKDEKGINKLLIKSLQISLLIAFPVCIYCLLFSKNILLFVCGISYIEAENTLKLLMILILPLILTNLFGNQILIPFGKENRFSQSVFIGMWINLILNLLLIPKYGASGAAFGSIITEIWNVFWMSHNEKKYKKLFIKNIKFMNYLFSITVSSLGSIIVYMLCQKYGIFIQLVLTSIVYFTTYYIILIILKEPILYNTVQKLLKKN